MSGPDPSKPLPSATGVLRAQPDDASFETDFADLAARFAAQSGGGLSPELSADLALEIVLNEIVEQACLATGATGAAVVLPRDGEMICRASSGTTSPELGSRLDIASGLSGECIRTRRTQRCDDVLIDERADIEASQRLGVRSVIVMPLVQGTELLGVFELFSSQAYAFGDRDEGTLEILTGRILSALERATHMPGPPIERVPGLQAGAGEPAGLPAETELPAETTSHETMQEIAPEASEPVRRRFDFATWALGTAVVICAVLLGVLLGLHFTRQKTTRTRRVTLPAATVPAQTLPVTTTTSSKATSAPAARSAAVKANAAPAVPPGGLRVYENGKEVFRLPPPENEDASEDTGMQPASSVEPDQVVELSPAAAEGSLLHRVEPLYPDDARQQGIQGPVVLEVHVGPDGGVQDVQVVSGPEQLIAASTNAVKQWRFKPHMVKGRPVEMETTVTLNFRLPQ